MAIFAHFIKLTKSKEVKSIAIYTFSNFFNKGVSFLLLFYFTRVLSESDYGFLNLFNNSILFLMPFISMGILQSVNTDYFKLEKNEFRNFFTTTLLMPVGVTMIAIAVFFFFRHQLHDHYLFPTFFIVLIPVIGFFNFIFEQLINMIRNKNEPIKYQLINMGGLFIEMGLAVFFISFLHKGWIGRIMGIFISSLVVAGYGFIYFKQKGFIFGRFQKKYIYKELLYSIPIIIMQVSIFCMSASGGYFIEFFTHDYSAIGIYSVAAIFASIIIVLCSAILHYFYPKIYGLLSSPQLDYKAFKRVFLNYSIIMLVGTILIIAAIPVAYIFFLKQSYRPGLHYYFLICLGYFFWSITYFFYSFMLYHKMKRKILYLSLISIFVSCCNNYLFVKMWGSTGAAVAIFITYLILLVTTLFFVRKQVVPMLSKMTNHAAGI